MSDQKIKYDSKGKDIDIWLFSYHNFFCSVAKPIFYSILSELLAGVNFGRDICTFDVAQSHVLFFMKKRFFSIKKYFMR